MRYILRFLGILFTAGAILFAAVAVVAGVVIWHYSRDLPDYTQLSAYEPPVTTRMHAGDGSLLAEYSRERRLYLPVQSMPPMLINAFLSAEDKNFYRHPGVDVEGIARASVYFFRREKGRRPQGASTITQQVAKNFLLTNEQSFDRKIKEMLVALRIEEAFTKDRILELYLNEIYLGLSNYGVAAASLNYFGKAVNELELHEAAYLAALPKAPSDLHPFRNRERAVERRNYVLDRMAIDEHISRDAAEEAKKQPLGVNVRSLSPNTIAAGFFAEEVRRELAERYGEKQLYEGGLSVRTTLDPQMQQMARRALVDGLVRYDEAQGWRGPVQKLDLAAREWGVALAEVPLLADVQPWRLAVVLDVQGENARIGMQPRREQGEISRDRATGVVTADGIRWTRRQMRQVLAPGDVVHVEPLADRPGQFRLRQIPEVSGALVAMDPHTGRVLAMVGGFSFDQSKFNRATQAQRQPGSSFKPFVYAAALDNGYTPATIVMDSPIEIAQVGGEAWKPDNYDGKSTGPRTLRYGIEHSKNLMTVRLSQDVGMPLITDYARRFGIYDDMPPFLSMSLGAGETTVLKMTAGYSMLVNGGKRIRPTLIDRIQDRWGRTVFRHDGRGCETCDAERWSGQEEPVIADRREQVLDPLSAYQITSVLEGVVVRGTGGSIKEVGKPLAGKTGTTNDAKDVWFVGFSPDLAVGVYMGFDRPRSLGSSATAGQYAAPIFRDFMKQALADKPATPFRVPPGIKLVKINRDDGTRAQGAEGIVEAFKPGTGPNERGGRGDAPMVFAPDFDRAVGSGTGGLY